MADGSPCGDEVKVQVEGQVRAGDLESGVGGLKPGGAGGDVAMGRGGAVVDL